MITQWDWADPKAYLHDEISTDKRNPTVNANGLIYGSPEESRDYLPVLDPVHNTISQVKIPYRDPDTPGQPKPLAAVAVLGRRGDLGQPHDRPQSDVRCSAGACGTLANPGRATIPAFCKAGSSLPSAKLTPVDRSGRQLAVYDPATKQTSMIDTCFGTHHLLFAEDANNTLWTSSGGGGGVVGWLNTKMWDQTHDAQKSQGWTALVLDTNGNGKRDAYRGGRAEGGLTAPSGESLGTSSAFNGDRRPDQGHAPQRRVLRSGDRHRRDDLGQRAGISRRDRAPESGIESAGNRAGGILRGAVEQSEGAGVGLFAARHGYRPQQRRLGGAGQRAPGQLRPAQMQRSAERPDRDRPALSGRLDAVSRRPGPNFKNVKDSGSADSHYYDWVDQFDTLGLGKNTPIVTGNSSDSLIALVNGKFVVMRVPYPLGFFAKGMDGRIDDPKAGWKGKGSLDHLGHAHAVPQRDRKGNDPARWFISRFGRIRLRIRA